MTPLGNRSLLHLPKLQKNQSAWLTTLECVHSSRHTPALEPTCRTLASSFPRCSVLALSSSLHSMCDSLRPSFSACLSLSPSSLDFLRDFVLQKTYRMLPLVKEHSRSFASAWCHLLGILRNPLRKAKTTQATAQLDLKAQVCRSWNQHVYYLFHLIVLLIVHLITLRILSQ